MGRRKKTIQLETESLEETTNDTEASEEWEAEEAEALAAEEAEAEAKEDAEEASEVEVKAEEEPVVEAAPKKKRAPRKRKPKAVPKLEVAAEESKEENEETEEDSEEQHLREDVAVASVSIQKSMDSMVKQWSSIKDISNTVATNFDRIHKQMNDMQANYAEALEKLSRQVPSRPAPLTKMAMGVSVFSVIVSMLSFSFAQSARNSLVAHVPTPRVSQSTQTAAAPKVQQPEFQAPELAFNPTPVAPKKRSPIRTKK